MKRLIALLTSLAFAVPSTGRAGSGGWLAAAHRSPAPVWAAPAAATLHAESIAENAAGMEELAAMLDPARPLRAGAEERGDRDYAIGGRFEGLGIFENGRAIIHDVWRGGGVWMLALKPVAFDGRIIDRGNSAPVAANDPRLAEADYVPPVGGRSAPFEVSDLFSPDAARGGLEEVVGVSFDSDTEHGSVITIDAYL